MNDRDSRIILCKNINIDKEYKNVLSYNTEEMLALCRSNEHFINEKTNYSFIRVQERTRINTDFTYSECLKANYIAMQNPDYDNKWFFAFIESIEYNSDNATIINFTIDSWTTFFNDWNPRHCVVLREHVNDDSIGANTYPETLETGEYINLDKQDFGLSTCHAVICTTEDPFNEEGNYPYNEINSVPSGLHYFLVGDFTSVNFIGWLTNWAVNKSDLSLINSIFMVPDTMTNYDNIDWDYALPGEFNYAPYKKLPTRITGAFEMGESSITKPYNNIDGYIPKNNKLFVYPYNVLVADNNGGSSYEYKYEDFNSENCTFKTVGAITPGCSIKTIPKNYKNVGTNYSESITAMKLPVGSWSSDVYTNWLTQNGVNIGVSLVGSASSIVGGAGMMLTGAGAVAGASMMSSGTLGVAQTLNEVYQHSRIPNQVQGNINSGDIAFASGNYNFSFYRKTIKSEYAKMIDDYFTRYGYLVNKIKLPNITGRKYFNYIQISSDEIIGYGNVPTSHMTNINNACRRGVTIWHDHNQIGNYNLDNTII